MMVWISSEVQAYVMAYVLWKEAFAKKLESGRHDDDDEACI
jgi:hypothetical protein